MENHEKDELNQIIAKRSNIMEDSIKRAAAAAAGAAAMKGESTIQRNADKILGPQNVDKIKSSIAKVERLASSVTAKKRGRGGKKTRRDSHKKRKNHPKTHRKKSRHTSRHTSRG